MRHDWFLHLGGYESFLDLLIFLLCVHSLLLNTGTRLEIKTVSVLGKHFRLLDFPWNLCFLTYKQFNNSLNSALPGSWEKFTKGTSNFQRKFSPFRCCFVKGDEHLHWNRVSSQLHNWVGTAFIPGSLWRKSVCVQREMDFNAYCQFFFALVSEKKIRKLRGGSFELLRMVWISLNFHGSAQGGRWCFPSAFGF